MNRISQLLAPTALGLLFACGIHRGPGLLVATTPDPKTGKMVTTNYGPYYELEGRTPDQKFSYRLVATLGPERIPPGYKHTGPFASDLDQAYRDGMVEWATEIYIFNRTESPITINKIEIKPCFMDRVVLTNEMTVPGKKSVITPPLISIHSNYGTQCEVSFKFDYLGETTTVNGIAKRLTLEELKAKYGGK
ncbi:hypothetical protein [Geothrix terrae]|uniref:hypothetical protein n=1 Tax=Geothrix terrae TaxID=2922720 RepID=UPI001FAB4957|nr:hypothetical protein [Geothrix terrae]